MITIKNVQTLDQSIIDYTLSSQKEEVIDVQGKLLLLPGMVDTHLNLMTRNRENWQHGLFQLIKAGITTLVESPEWDVPSDSKNHLQSKKKHLDLLLNELEISFPYYFFFEATPENLPEIGLSKNFIKGVFLKINPNHGFLDDKWENVFRTAAWENLPIILNLRQDPGSSHPKQKIIPFLEKAIELTKKQNALLYILNVATQAEIQLIQEAKKQSLLVFGETTPELLYEGEENNPLWEAIHSDLIETIGSGYQSSVKLPKNTSSVRYTFPLLFSAYKKGQLSLEKIIHLTSYNACSLFDLKKTQDVVLVDPDKMQTISLAIKQQPQQILLTGGWPVYTIVNGRIFKHGME